MKAELGLTPSKVTADLEAHFLGEWADALQEVVNIGMGRAGAALAKVMGGFVKLSVPSMTLVRPHQLREAVHKLSWVTEDVSAVRQAFFHDLDGEVIAVFDTEGCRGIAETLGHDPLEASEAADREMLLDITNILVGACMNGVAKELGIELSFSAPALLVERASLDDVLSHGEVAFNLALLINVKFIMEKRSFTSQLLILMPRDAFDRLIAALNRFLESL
jgi:chemotaxis protein CheC